VDRETALLAAAVMVANRMTAGETESYLLRLAPSDRQLVQAALQALVERMPAFSQSLSAPAPPIMAAVVLPPVPAAAYYQRVVDELAEIEDALQRAWAKGFDADRVSALIDARGRLTARQKALEGILNPA
jgi:hypothetical protein